MEPIDYGGALRRRWWLPVVLGVVGGLAIILLFPGTHAKSVGDVKGTAVSSWKWESTALVGAPPGGRGATGALSGEVTTQEIVFYAGETAVVATAAKAAGLTQPVDQLQGVVFAVGPSKTFDLPGEVLLTAYGPTAKVSADFVNAYAKALGSYMDGLISGKQQAQLQQAKQTVNELALKFWLPAARPRPT